MAITDHVLMDGVLEAIDSVAPMALLHREESVARHEVGSDVDLCLGGDQLAVMAAVAPELARAGIFLLLAWNYDRGSYSFFFSDAEGSAGAQIDVLSDSVGAGRYGVRTSEMLSTRCTGLRWPRVSSLDEALYELRKSQVKRDAGRATRAREAVDAIGVDLGVTRAREIFTPSARAAVVGALIGDPVRLPRVPSIWRSRLMRPSRLVRRCGFWAVVPDRALEDEARHAVACLDGVLIGARMVVEPAFPLLLKTLWRPLLLVSVVRPRQPLKPDVVLMPRGGTGDIGLAARLVRTMHLRARLRLEHAGGSG